MNVIGICRFSYPALGGFKRMHATIAERERYLYAPDRMKLRFRHFESLTLPSIQAQDDPDFTFLVVIGDSLPKPWRDRLHDITAPVPQIKIVSRKPSRHRDAMQQAILAELEGVKTETIQFRLDDDDAVARSFVASTRWFCKHTVAMRQKWEFMAIEYSSGYSVALGPDGIRAEEVQAPFWSCGLAIVTKPGAQRTVMNFGHHKLHQKMPTLINPLHRMFLRAKHDDNDSADGYTTGPLHPLTEKERRFFKSRFNVDESRVKAVFSAPAALRDKV